MDKKSETQHRDGGLLYRLEVQGTIRQARSRWLGAERVTPRGSNTVILLRVVDQSDLFGRLRRIHDLNLQLICVERLNEDGTPACTSHAGESQEDHDSHTLG